MDVSREEQVTSYEETEMRHFISLVVETALMQEAHKFLVSRGKAAEDLGEFQQQLYDIWLRLYHRSADERSSVSYLFRTNGIAPTQYFFQIPNNEQIYCLIDLC